MQRNSKKRLFLTTLTFAVAILFCSCSQKSNSKSGQFNLMKDFVDIPGKNIRMLKTEVTQGLYESVMGYNYCEDKNPQKPVEQVSFYDALYFCNVLSEQQGLTPVYIVNGTTDVHKWNYQPGLGSMISVVERQLANGFRLPTNEEWVFAAKGGENYIFAGSNDPDKVAWYYDNSYKKNTTHPVAQKKPNGYGLYDMCGNVYEMIWRDCGGNLTPHRNTGLSLGGN